MKLTTFHGRRAASIENDHLRVTVLIEGGHIAEVFHRACGVNPLWVPPWRSIEPSSFRPGGEHGDGVEAKLLSGIMGQNLCLDLFGGPSEPEATAGIGVHGESSVDAYDVQADGSALQMSALFPLCGLHFQRWIALDGETVRIREVVENPAATDRPIAWTQHVTLGPPFLGPGTRFLASATRSRVYEKPFGAHDYLQVGADFDWPMAPRADGTRADMRSYPGGERSSAYTAHLMDPSREEAFFSAWAPDSGLLFGYAWKHADFPWLGIWEENRSRTHAPWSGVTVTRGMEFGVSPVPESRREMIDRGTTFGVPGYAWVPARGRLAKEYRIVTRQSAEPAEL